MLKPRPGSGPGSSQALGLAQAAQLRPGPGLEPGLGLGLSQDGRLDEESRLSIPDCWFGEEILIFLTRWQICSRCHDSFGGEWI